MPAFNKFNQFVQDVGQKVHNLNADSLFILLTNTAPNAADTVVDTTTTPCTVKATSNAVEIAAANGYVKGGGQAATNAYTQSAGTAKLTANAVTFTAAGGAFGPFRYAVLYNNTGGAAATRPVIGWWDYGSSLSVNDTEAFKIGKDATGANWDSAVPVLSFA